MSFTDEMLKCTIRAYLRTRCRVSSQHKLPTVAEIKQVMAKRVRFNDIEFDQIIKIMIKDRNIISYGPHLSDHKIETL